MSLNQPITNFSGLNVWIIGASSGIGNACAKWFADKGSNLILSARRIEPLKQLENNLPKIKSDQTFHSITLDVTQGADVTSVSNQVIQTLRNIDILLFVSGIYTPVRADDFDLDVSKNMIDTNLMGPMRVVSSLMPQFLKQSSGHIAIVGSVAGYSGLPKSLVYGPTKAALLNFAESLYYDLKPRGINVHIICPGFVETPATAINDFKMPALITADQAAEYIGQGLQKGEFEIHFPKKFSYFLKFLRILPYPIYFWLLKTFVKI
jgi:short-subunit dehydrogenase